MFERVLREALDVQQVKDALDRSGGTLDREQLRTRALQARTDIAAAAAVEYRDFLISQARAAAQGEGRGPGSGQEAGERGGGGLLPVLAVLVPGLGAASAVVFLTSGYGLRFFGGRPYIGDGLITAGLIGAAVAVGAAVGDLVYVLVAAARNRSVGQAGASHGTAQEVSRAREAWELALLEHGVVPFLLGCLEEVRAAEPDDRHASGVAQSGNREG